MDRKKKIKRVITVCFVLVCGIGVLVVRYDGQRKEQIVLEKQTNATGLSREERDDSESGTGKNAGRLAEEALDRESVSGSTVTGNGTEEPPVLYVHICGAVNTEGVYCLDAGSRMTDGITAAGGFLETADTTYHNLAARLTDGQRVYVPTKEETRELSTAERLADTVGAPYAGSTALSSDGVVSKQPDVGTKVNLNTAGPEELMTLSGIGQAKAESIIQYREKVGAFQSIEELKHVSGIGDAMFERVREDIVVE